MKTIDRLRRTAAALAALMLGAVLAGCASSAPAPVLLALPAALDPGGGAAAAMSVAAAAPAAALAPAVAASAPLLAVRRVGIPEYLVSRRVRFRADASTLAEWPNTYWAERIEIGVSREFISALRSQLPGWQMCDATCGDQLPTLALQIDLVPMDFMRSARTLQARARIALSSAGASPRIQQVQELVYELPAGADTAQAQAQAITELLRQVAAATARLVRTTAR